MLNEELAGLIHELNNSLSGFMQGVDGAIFGMPIFKEWEGRTSTLTVTDECNLRCSYCYCTKTPKRMTWDIAKSYIDLVFSEQIDLCEIPKEKQEAINHRKIFEFIGGEPLLESVLMFKSMDYIIEKVNGLPDNHPWKRTDWYCPTCDKNHDVGFRFMLSTNGLLLNDIQIQQKLLSYPKSNLFIAVTLDGTKEMHDLCRLTTEGKGSYDDVMRAWRWLSHHFPSGTTSTKSTIAHENLDYVSDITKFFYDLGLTYLSQNCVFENVWERGDQIKLFQQLVKTADFLIEKQRYTKMGVRWFSPMMLQRATNNGKWCGAGIYMDACDWSGATYPCLRFKQLKKQEPYVMGSVNAGVIRDPQCIAKFEDSDVNSIYNPLQKQLSGLKCQNCPISSQCSDCQAYAYDCFGRLEAKSPFICPMHKAAAVANIYFFSTLLGVPIAPDYLQQLLEEWTKDDYFLSDGEFNYDNSHSI